jgi:hypothetical protein
MSAPDVPRKYQGSPYTRQRYIEGWQDGRAGRPHAHARHAEEIIREQGKAQYEAYSAGHAAGREAPGMEPSWLAQAGALLEELEQMELGTVPNTQLTELAKRLDRMAEKLVAHIRADMDQPGQ